MEPHINLVAVLVASIANMFVGFLWYGKLFGEQWAEAMGWKNLSQEQINKMREQAKYAYPQTFVGGFLMMYVFAHILGTYQASHILDGFRGAFWMWVGFVVPVKYGECLWGDKSIKAFLIDIGYYLAILSVASIILVYWK